MEEGEISDTMETEAPVDDDTEEKGKKTFQFQYCIAIKPKFGVRRKK